MAFVSNGPPPSYGSTLKLSLLCLDGGGTRTFVQLQILCELMHRLAWDMGLISSRPSTPQKCQVYPADCFDYIGAGGCGAIIAYLLAAGHTAESALSHYITLAPLLASTRLHAHPAYPGESLTELSIALDACLPRHELMQYNKDWIVDIPARANIWIATPPPSKDNDSLDEKSQFHFSASNGRGVLVPKGAPIRHHLLPLVLAQVEREMRGLQAGLEHTLEFLQAVCPVFEDCDLLLALGSGEVPAPLHSIRPTAEKDSVNSSPSSTDQASSSYWLATNLFCLFTWLCYTTTSCSSDRPSTPPQLPAPLAPCTSSRAQSHTLNSYIPTRAYGRSYIRLSPDLTTRAYGTPRAGLTTYSSCKSPASSTSSSSLGSSFSGQLAWPADWEPEHFSEHRMLTGSYCGKAEIGISMDRVVDILGRRDLPGVVRRASRSRVGGGSSVNATVGWGNAPQYSPVASGSGIGNTSDSASAKTRRQVEALRSAFDNQRRLDAMVFERAGYVC